MYFINTIRFLKFKQIYYRIWFFLITPKIDQTGKFKLRIVKNRFSVPVKKKISLVNEDTFCFLNNTKSLSNIHWDGQYKKVSKLWRYNQHYFDDLNAHGTKKRKSWHEKLLKRWVRENSLGRGVGWEPYPTSLRIVNWIKWSLNNNSLPKICIKSLFIQTRWLNKRIEWHILGNHLFSNAKALIFAGLFFSSKESEAWLEKGLKIINAELNEQVLADGGNFERSTMYHSIFLEDILDIINILKVYNKVFDKFEPNKLVNIVLKMLKWLETMCHPDGEISFFNDATFGIAPKLSELKSYSRRLGLKYNTPKFEKITQLHNSGYIRLSSKMAKIFLDVAPIGPQYLTGHSHADTLSFEMSLFGKRLFVNSGVSEYGVGLIRQYERSTKAHNTVEIDYKNSSEVWSGFRVARRAYPFDLSVKNLKDFININCAHDGYKRLKGKPIHYRNWKFFNSSLIINDNINGSFKKAFAYFHFHPSVKIYKKQNNIWNLKIFNNYQIILQVKKGKGSIIKSHYSCEFGRRIKKQCLKVILDKIEGSSVHIFWYNKKS